MSISEFVQIFLSICGGVSIVGGAAAVIFKWITPAFRLNKRVETLEEHDRRDYESLRRIAERDSLILEVLSTMLDSQISGNNVEELKKNKAEAHGVSCTESALALVRGMLMKLYVFTKKDIDRFLLECNFTPDEERLFRLRCKEYTLEYCAEQMNVSISTAKRLSRRVNNKIIKVC